MERVNLGKTEIKVSRICLGTWAWGGDKWWGRQQDRDSEEAFEAALARGINFIDTAPVYGFGRAEKILGRLLRQKREDVVLATKVGLRWQGGKITINLKRQSMQEELAMSLQRLNTDYIDLYQVHWPDKDTPLEETAAVMGEFYERGVIKAVGVSNFSLSQMEEFMKYCPLHCLQPPYNMFRRDIEEDIIPFCRTHNIAIITYASLESGILSGKFFFGSPLPNDLNRRRNPNLKPPLFTINKKYIKKLKEVISGYPVSLAQLAIAWILHQAGITSAIVGCRNAYQAKENSMAADVSLPSSTWEKIEKILQQRTREISLLA